MQETPGKPSSAHDNELLNAAFEATGIGVCFLNEEGRVLRTNRAFCAMLGYDTIELTGRHWSIAAPPDVAARGERFFSALFTESPRLSDEWQVRRKDGTLLTALVSFKTLTLSDGARRLALTFTDIHQRKAAEQTALRRSKDLYRDVVENVSEAIVVTQGDRLIYGNPRAAELSGYALDELRQMPFRELVHPEDRDDIARRFRRRMRVAPGSGRHLQFRVVRKDGHALWVESSAVRIEWEGEPAMLSFLSDQTARRRQQEALIKSEEHHRQVVDNATEGILVLQDGVIVFANSRMHQLVGVARGELLGQSFLDDIHPDDRQGIVDRYTRRMRGEEVDEHAQFRTLDRRSGQYIWEQVSVVTIEWEGRPAALCFVTDITERKTLEDRLKQTLDERETILENSIAGMVFLNPAGRVNWANSAMFQMFRVAPSDPIGKSLEAYYPSRDAYLQTGAAVAEAVSRGVAYEAELQMRRGDGSLFWAYLSGRAVNPRDLSRGTVWVAMDITKRRQLEYDLNKSEEHYRQVVNNVTECILVVQDGHIVFANPRVMQLTGYSQEDLFELPFVDAIHPDDRPLVLDHHLRRLRGEEVEQYYQFRVVNRLSEAIVWVQLSAVMIEWEGRPATLSFMTDITERRRLEESLRQSMAERIRLETMQIQGELKEAELARRHAEETTRAKSMFLANMSHEIRTPMNAIIGMAHLALRTELDDRQRDYVEKIRSAGISLLGIINDILDFSKIEAGKLDMELVSFNLDDVLDNVATVTGARAHEKRLEYLFQFPLDLPRGLVGDPLRLGQVLINLINNAIKFTEHGEIHVACRRLDMSADKILLQFTVRDTGIGMAPDQTVRLFNAFSQADESTTRKYGGTGLGLSISKRLVELMGGTIALESAVGAGTTIRFTAWFGLAETSERRRSLPAALKGMRMLVADDNASAREVLADGLRALPMQVELAAGAAEALAMIRAADADRPYAAVLTDLDMPGMSGNELVEAVRGDSGLRSPPRMVLLGGHAREETRREIGRAPADAFLVKPVNASSLIDTLVQLLAPRKSAGPDSAAGADRSTRSIPRFTGLTVLLVEDNDINQQIASELLQAAGIDVEIAGNGRIALEMLAAAGDRYGMVFMDVQMPEMDGHEATRRLRADPRFRTLPVVAMTAHALVEERERCFASGMNGHLAKPVDPAELYRTVARWCPRHVAVAETTPEIAPEIAPETEPDTAADTGECSAEPELKIAGLDVADGLTRTLGNRAFYLQMLERFRDGQRETVDGIRAALEQDRALAERLAHSLRGVAGLLGASSLVDLSGQLESDIRRGAAQSELQAQLDELDSSMRALHAAIDAALPAPPSGPAATGPVEPAAAQALIVQCMALLRSSDYAGIELLEHSAAVLAAAVGMDACREMLRAARQYDFDAALVTLKQAAQRAGYDTDETTRGRPV